jgi:hypothetical protein
MNDVEPSDSDWSPPIVLVKNTDVSERYCVDYRKLNHKGSLPNAKHRIETKQVVW